MNSLLPCLPTHLASAEKTSAVVASCNSQFPSLPELFLEILAANVQIDPLARKDYSSGLVFNVVPTLRGGDRTHRLEPLT